MAIERQLHALNQLTMNVLQQLELLHSQLTLNSVGRNVPLLVYAIYMYIV